MHWDVVEVQPAGNRTLKVRFSDGTSEGGNMSTITFDTLKFAKKLESAGMSKEAAEAIAEAQNEAFDELTKTKDLATKSDLHEMKYDLLKWIVGLAFAQFVLLIGILLRLPH